MVGAAGGRRAEREYRFYTAAGEVTLEEFLAAIVRRGEARVVGADEREPAYRLTAKGRKALEGAA
jgi:hypothetical protein